MEAIAQLETKNQTVDLQMSQERAQCYALLASLLAQAPTDEQLQHLAQLDVPEGQPGAESWRLLKMSAGQAQSQLLQQEYQDLFVGIGRGELVPYGSWYMTGFLMEKPLLMLRRDLQNFGYQREDEVKEPEDHAASLCEVMGLLIQDMHCVQTQNNFFSQHMAPWMGRLFEDLQQAKGATFYRAVGYIGATFMDLESDYFG